MKSILFQMDGTYFWKFASSQSVLALVCTLSVERASGWGEWEGSSAYLCLAQSEGLNVNWECFPFISQTNPTGTDSTQPCGGKLKSIFFCLNFYIDNFSAFCNCRRAVRLNYLVPRAELEVSHLAIVFPQWRKIQVILGPGSWFWLRATVQLS